MLLVDGISFIEHMSYDNFNEGTRFQSTVKLQQRYFGACHQMGADAIYATNENRKYSTKNKIATSFIAKGNEGQLKEQKSQMRSILSKVRSTVLEGSFGNEKNHYQLNKIKAKTQSTEKAWIFFSLLACNAKQIAGRIQEAKNKNDESHYNNFRRQHSLKGWGLQKTKDAVLITSLCPFNNKMCFFKTHANTQQ